MTLARFLPLRWSKLAGLSALALAGLSCSEPLKDLELSVDLVALNSESTKEEGLVLTFGTEAARAHMQSGWTKDRYDDVRKVPYVVSVGRASTLAFERSVQSPFELSFSARTMPREGVQPTAIHLYLNGNPVEQLPVIEGTATYSTTLPSLPQRVGYNQLTFRYEHPESPEGAKLGPLAWFKVALGAVGSQPDAMPARRELFIPFGKQVDYYTLVPPGAQLAIEEITLQGNGVGELEIWVQDDASEAKPLATLSAKASRQTVALETAATEGLLLSLRAQAEGLTEAGAGLKLFAPGIWSPKRQTPAPVNRTELAEVPSLEEPSEPPSVILYLVDTLRADRLGAYGYERPISPHLDRFANEATVFDHAVGQSSWTRSSVASLLTGQLPMSHGAIGRLDQLSSEKVLLPEMLKQRGYQTAAFITNPNVQRQFGFEQGYDAFVAFQDEKRSDAVNDGVFKWFEEEQPSKPLFLYVHTADPHNPYTPEKSFRKRFAREASAFMREMATLTKAEKWTRAHVDDLSALYDAEIAFNDEQFGRFLDFLRSNDLYDNAFVIFLSDHGEEFLDHGTWRHGRNLHVATTRVPLVVKFPKQTQGRRSQQVVQQVDILPTILDWLGEAKPQDVEGHSLMAERPSDLAAFSHLHLDGPLDLSIVRGDWKLIVSTDTRHRTKRRLYRWREDPLEQEDLSSTYPILLAALENLLRERTDSADSTESEEVELDPELRARLEALGYL